MLRAALVSIAFAWLASACSSPDCTSSPGNLTGTCTVANAGQCVEFSNLGSSDQSSTRESCVALGGTWGDAACPTTARIGTCMIPPTDSDTNVYCSPQAMIEEHYYAPAYELDTAQAACAGAPGTTFTPG